MDIAPSRVARPKVQIEPLGWTTRGRSRTIDRCELTTFAGGELADNGFGLLADNGFGLGSSLQQSR
jgi:hypothetical protein